MPLCFNDKKFLKPQSHHDVYSDFKSKKVTNIDENMSTPPSQVLLDFSTKCVQALSKKKNTKMNTATNTFRKLSLR